jgi:hypothetical protein
MRSAGVVVDPPFSDDPLRRLMLANRCSLRHPKGLVSLNSFAELTKTVSVFKLQSQPTSISGKIPLQ